MAGDLAVEGGDGEVRGRGVGVVDEFGVGVGPDVGEGVEQGRDLAGP
ncbi:hypothetical protein ACWEV4_30505 [Streptomyces sp. NPDC003860]